MRALLTALLFALLCLQAPPAMPASAPASSPPPAPGLMLATHYRDGLEVSDFLVSEKLDGVRGRWDGQRLWTRGGAPVKPPPGFTHGWPSEPMDGELWLGRGRFDEVSAIVRSAQADPRAWQTVRFMVFDLPSHPGPFAERVARMRTLVAAGTPTLAMVPQQRFGSSAELDAELARIVAAGGEGLMLHRADARYRAGRSDTLLKYKAYQDAEAQVVAHVPGKGKYQGMMGAVQVRTPDGRSFRIGSGFTDAQRAQPPALGTWLTYRYNGVTASGLPRFARFVRVREEMPPPDPPH